MEIQLKSKEYYTFFSKILIFCLTGTNICLINNKRNHFSEKYIFDRIDGSVISMKRIKNMGFVIQIGCSYGRGSSQPLDHTRGRSSYAGKPGLTIFRERGEYFEVFIFYKIVSVLKRRQISLFFPFSFRIRLLEKSGSSVSESATLD